MPEQNTVKNSFIRVGGDMHIGNIYNTYIEPAPNAFVIFIIAMDYSAFETVQQMIIKEIDIQHNRKLYITDDDDLEDDLISFFNASVGAQLRAVHYESGWKPFIHSNKSAINKPIETIIANIFENRETVVRTIWLDSTVALADIIQDDADKKIFFDLLEKAVILIDPLSLTHPVCKEYFDEIYHNAEVGGIIAVACTYSDNEVKRFSTLLLKRKYYRWHRNCPNPDIQIFFGISNENMLENQLVNICKQLGFSTHKNIFKKKPNDKDIPTITKLMNKL